MVDVSFVIVIRDFVLLFVVTSKLSRGIGRYFIFYQINSKICVSVECLTINHFKLRAI